MEEYRMKCSRYKTRYSDCETVYDSYDKITKTILVLIPEGRMKASGTRNQHYGYYTFTGQENGTDRQVTVTVKAISMENARQQLRKDYPTCNFND